MHNVLMALQTDLASSIAIRFICQMEELGRFDIQTVHVPDLGKDEDFPGVGFVQKVWEDGVLENAREEISRLMQKENLIRHRPMPPKILLGERDQVILNELQQRDYDIFIEGLLHSFDPDAFLKKLESDLYRSLSRPILMVKNLVKLNRGIQVVGDQDIFPSLLSWFFKLWKDLPLKTDFLICQFEDRNDEVVFLENDSHVVSKIEDGWSRSSTVPFTIKTVKGPERRVAELIRDHALVMSEVPMSWEKMADILAKSPCPILLCPRSKYNENSERVT